MKKFIVPIIIFLAIIIYVCLPGSKNLKYHNGKDTIDAYGDGTYQVGHAFRDSDGESIKILYNREYNETFVMEIDEYEKIDDYVYFVGRSYTHNVWCKLSISDNFLCYYMEDYDENDTECWIYCLDEMIIKKQVEMYSSYDDFSEEDKEVFEKLSGS